MESLARHIQFYGRREHHFLESNEELWRGSTQHTSLRRITAFCGVYKTARRSRNLRHSLLSNRQPALEISPCLATTTAPETTPWCLSGVPVTFPPPPPSGSTLRVWASEMLSACPAAVRTEPGSWATARRPAVNPPAASQPTAGPAAGKLPAALPVATRQDPAKEPAVCLLLLTSPGPASPCLTGRWPTWPAAGDPRAFSPAGIAPRVPCPAASDLCALSSVDARLCPMCSALTVHLALPAEACSFFTPANNHAEDPRRKFKLRPLLLLS